MITMDKQTRLLANQLINALNKGGVNNRGQLKFTTRKAMTQVLKNITNPSKRAAIIRSIGNAVSNGAIAIGSATAETLVPYLTMKEQTKREEAKYNLEAQKVAAEANQRLISEINLWNSGVSGNPSTSMTPGSESKPTGEKTTGSFLGG